MTTKQRTQPTSLDQHALSVVPVVLGGPSLRRRSGEPRRSSLRRPAASATLPSADRDRLSIPR